MRFRPSSGSTRAGRRSIWLRCAGSGLSSRGERGRACTTASTTSTSSICSRPGGTSSARQLAEQQAILQDLETLVTGAAARRRTGRDRARRAAERLAATFRAGLAAAGGRRGWRARCAGFWALGVAGATLGDGVHERVRSARRRRRAERALPRHARPDRRARARVLARLPRPTRRGRAVGALTALFVLALALVSLRARPADVSHGWELMTLLPAVVILVVARRRPARAADRLHLPGGHASRRGGNLGRDPAARARGRDRRPPASPRLRAAERRSRWRRSSGWGRRRA